MEVPTNDCCSICHGNFHVPCQANCSHWFCGNCILQVWNYGSAFQPCSCPLCRRQINLLIPTDAASQQRNNSEVAEVLGKIERYNRHFGARSNGLIQIIQFFCSRTIILMLVLESCILPSKPLLLSWNLFICNPMKLYNSDFYKLRMQQISKLMHDFFFTEIPRPSFPPQEVVTRYTGPSEITSIRYQNSCLFVSKLMSQYASKCSSILASGIAMFLSAIYILSPVDIIPEGIVGVIGLLDDALIALICFLHIATLYRSVLVFRHGGS
ncbi:hypothetical protein RHGRI_033074 [Rhododendron griersonianum]|uniref:E3 ubiquitin-protein ligase RNF170 n=1 Tax=Rhododendron griersonianum TaxID=479676 RepID=A0AAV6HZ20_9ERIC|nr:hypothetical protein RHGRI_033074 [Rhododendron griersonianum]